MDIDVVESTLEPEAAPQIPRMGLRHLMLWMFFSAAFMAYVVNNYRNSGLSQRVDPLFIVIQVYVLLSAIGVGAMAAAAVTLTSACRHHRCIVMREPGHWLAMAMSIGYAWMALAMLVSALWNAGAYRSSTEVMFAYTIMQLLEAIVYFIAWRRQPERRWRWLFVTAGVLEIVGVLGSVTAAIYASPFPNLGLLFVFRELVIIAMLVIALLEMLRGKRRDWVHTFGITGLFIATLAKYINTIWILISYAMLMSR